MMARWLQREPRILLLDEPTQGVDVVARSDIYRSIADAARRGAAVVVASSDLDELLALCNRVIVLRDGVAVADLDAATTPRDRIARLMMADDPTELDDAVVTG
jgi:ribose transport system ATP-binding protein